MKKIYIVRHGQSHTNAGGHLMPNADIPLTELGHRQAKEVADWLLQTIKDDGEAISSINVSKYLRTQLTAEPLVELTGLEPRVIDGLQEFNYLAFENIEHMKVAEVLEMANRYWEEQAPEYINGIEYCKSDDEKSNNPESFQQFEQRTGKVLEVLHSLEDGTHVVYSHGLWISMLIWKILAQPVNDNKAMQNFRHFELSIRARNCEVFLLTLEADKTPAITKVRTRQDNSYNAI